MPDPMQAQMPDPMQEQMPDPMQARTPDPTQARTLGWTIARVPQRSVARMPHAATRLKVTRKALPSDQPTGEIVHRGISTQPMRDPVSGEYE
jgi:hypothetical protein